VDHSRSRTPVSGGSMLQATVGTTQRRVSATMRLAGAGLATILATVALGGCVTDLGGSHTASPGIHRATASPGIAAPGIAADAIQTLLQTDSVLVDARTAPTVLAFYRQRQNAPAWTDGRGLTDLGRQLRDVLETAWVDGITDLPPLPAPGAATTNDPAALARLDVALTSALAAYVQRAMGIRPPYGTPWPGDATTTLIDISHDDPGAGRPGALFHVFGLEDRQARLRRAVLSYEAIARSGGWPTPPATGPKLEPGAVHPDISRVRARLEMSGDHTGPAPANPALYDAALAGSVRRFQDRHGLAVDGKIGPNTRAALAVPIDQRLRQMALNLKRLRDMPPAPPGRSVEVNIPAAHLEGRDNGITTFHTDVIVGRSDRQTPELTSAINLMVLNPTWTVPTTIAQRDILPKLQNDPDYLERSGFTVFSGWDREAEKLDPASIDWTAEDVNIRALRLRQAPGGGNALGRIKFMFPNDHDVYLHSTPSRSLFARAERTFSSGCVRLEDPMDFAEFLMNEEGQTAEALLARINRGGTQTVRPRQSVPLSIIYVTAWVDETGTVQFRDDVYGHDAQQMNRIARRPATSNWPQAPDLGPAAAPVTPVPAGGTETAAGQV